MIRFLVVVAIVAVCGVNFALCVMLLDTKEHKDSAFVRVWMWLCFGLLLLTFR